ncbi:MAG: DUF4093 domain-containing protein [Clostridiales bacterium]|nr:DUF4093 domain-containing protein [Clostridiales bacterium]
MKIEIPIAVEGKYDKIKLASIVDAQIITTDGFGVFASHEKTALIRRIAEPKGMIVLTDSDGAGLVIRNYFNSILPKNKLIHLYIPQIKGKERRKKSPSKAGTLGVEGIDAETLRRLLAPYAVGSTEAAKPTREVTKVDFFSDGLSGGEASAERRKLLCAKLDLPDNMSANALLAAVNLLCSYDEYKEMVK